jgi:CDP-glucose 4,6-dehydratase
MNSTVQSFWKGKRVFVTGHTGFKGGWMSLWLDSLGAEVIGYALNPPSQPNLYELANVARVVRHHDGDVRDLEHLKKCIACEKPDVIFHLAAQAIVRTSYANPVETFASNVMGTVNLLEAARQSETVRVIVVITSDKCYENRETLVGYREGDPMGGRDPYSSSKACAELVTFAYAQSFFSSTDSRAVLSSARAGNVIGGGDWAADRLVPDCMRALLQTSPILVRNPQATRPWQHVLEPLAGYLRYAERLWLCPRSMPRALNFGPYDTDIRCVSELVTAIVDRWGEGRWESIAGSQVHEAGLLSLDSMLARQKVGWAPRLDFRTAIDFTVDWYREYAVGAPMHRVTLSQISAYERLPLKEVHGQNGSRSSEPA